MSSTTSNTNHARIDPALVARVVREVMARLQDKAAAPVTPLAAPSPAPSTVQATVQARVLDVQMVTRASGAAIVIGPKTIVTPAAADEARNRGIAISRQAAANTANTTPAKPSNQRQWLQDAVDPQRGIAVQQQLARRGITSLGCDVILSDTPAGEVHRQISSHGKRAVMVTALADVDRFAAELSPTTWVLDMQRLNLMAAVNVVLRISQTGNPSS